MFWEAAAMVVVVATAEVGSLAVTEGMAGPAMEPATAESAVVVAMGAMAEAVAAVPVETLLGSLGTTRPSPRLELSLSKVARQASVVLAAPQH